MKKEVLQFGGLFLPQGLVEIQNRRHLNEKEHPKIYFVDYEGGPPSLKRENHIENKANFLVCAQHGHVRLCPGWIHLATLNGNIGEISYA